MWWSGSFSHLRVVGNGVNTRGVGNHGLAFQVSGGIQHSIISNNVLTGDKSNTAVGIHANGTGTTYGYNVICNNRCTGWDHGIRMRGALSNMVSGNLLYDCTTTFIDVGNGGGGVGKNNKGGSLTTALGVDGKWPNDELDGNYLRAYNIGF
jgi:hypothetical protein